MRMNVRSFKQVNVNYDLQLRALSERQRREYRDMITVLFETDNVPEYIRAESPPACVIRKLVFDVKLQNSMYVFCF